MSPRDIILWPCVIITTYTSHRSEGTWSFTWHQFSPLAGSVFFVPAKSDVFEYLYQSFAVDRKPQEKKVQYPLLYVSRLIQPGKILTLENTTQKLSHTKCQAHGKLVKDPVPKKHSKVTPKLKSTPTPVNVKICTFSEHKSLWRFRTHANVVKISAYFQMSTFNLF